MSKSTMLMEYDDFRTTEHLQEFISKEGFNRSIEAIKENAELDNKLNHLLNCGNAIQRLRCWARLWPTVR